MAFEQSWFAGGGSGRSIGIKASESFTTGDAYTLVTVNLPLQQGLHTTGNAHIYLYAVDGSHYPTGEPLYTIGTITAGELTSSIVWIEFSGLNYSMLAATEYAIVIELDEYDETYEDNENIPSIRWLSKNGYAGTPAHQYWYLDEDPDPDLWRHTTEYSIVSVADFGFIMQSGTPVPTKAENPSPADEATSVDFSALGLSWDDGGDTDTFDVYVGPVGALVLVSAAQAGTTLTVDTANVPWGETIYWRVDSTNAQGTTTGDTWSFDVVIVRSVKIGANGAFIVVAAKDGVYLSSDSGANWSRKTPDAVEDTDWEKGICSSDGSYIIVVSSADAIYRSANSGSSWAEITPADGDTFSVNKMATSDDGQFMVIVGQNSTDATESCYISTNYGATWTAKKPVAASITWTDCDISNDGTIIAVSTTSVFYISFDSGTEWTEQGMASTAEVWKNLSISGDGKFGLVANTNDNDEFFIGVNTALYSEATWAESPLTSAGRAILDDTTAAAQATTLGLGTGDTPTFATLKIIYAAEAALLLKSNQINYGDGDRRGTVYFANHTETTQAFIRGSHSGAADDVKGKLELYTNNGSVETLALTIDDTQLATFASRVAATGIELGHASDTTLTRVSAGVVAIEGVNIAMDGGAHHDGFSDSVGNEHIDHTGVTLTAGIGLLGGGDISTNRNFAVSKAHLEMFS